jgi:hypothetical protein
MFSAQSTRILDFPSKIAVHTAKFYIMTLVLCQEACLFLGITRGSIQLVSKRKGRSGTILNFEFKTGNNLNMLIVHDLN